MWTEKYRPKTLDEVVGNHKEIQTIKSFIEKGEVPNMLFIGPSGTGKTTVARIIAHKLLADTFDYNYSEFNASDDRSLDFLRKNVVEASKFRPIGGDGRKKIILLDEADGLLQSGFELLRSPIENSKTTRIIFTANSMENFIKAITSRLTPFLFKPIEKEEMIRRLQAIAETEGVEIDEAVLERICNQSEGDLRYAINVLEKTAITGDNELTTILSKYQ